MALGTICAGPEVQSSSCFTETGSGPCTTQNQVIQAACDYKTIPAPTDLRAVPLTYMMLDPGSRVKLQLIAAHDKFVQAEYTLTHFSNLALDRHLCPLGKTAGLESMTTAGADNVIRMSNSVIAKYIDSQAGQACRQVFDVIYAHKGGVQSALDAASVGIEVAQTPAIEYSVASGPFGQMYGLQLNTRVTPVQMHLHPYYGTLPVAMLRFDYDRDAYVIEGLTGGSLNEIQKGMSWLMEAAHHMLNASNTYVSIAYDADLVKIPGTAIPAGAFSMLPQADVDAVMAMAVLCPRSAEKPLVPDLAADLGAFTKDVQASFVSRMRAAVCEVLFNYNNELNMPRAKMLEEKIADPAPVLAEAAQRVQDIVLLAENMAK
jgi:hypothetical protein